VVRQRGLAEPEAGAEIVGETAGELQGTTGNQNTGIVEHHAITEDPSPTNMLTVGPVEIAGEDMPIRATDTNVVPDPILGMRDGLVRNSSATRHQSPLAFTGLIHDAASPIGQLQPTSCCAAVSGRVDTVVCRAKVQSVRPFGVFVALSGFRRHGMVHSSQVADEVTFSREDEDEMKVKTMDFYAPAGSEVTSTPVSFCTSWPT